MVLTMSAPDSELMSYAVRMVIPMKREFGRSLDVQQFIHDLPYAKEVIELALSSKDQRLNGYAEYVQTKLFGPRGTTASAPGAAMKSVPQLPVADDASKATVMGKYKTRLR
jgi:hypothetical protein